ncbi:MAG: hypothetical protein H0W99_14550 [Acidobacteria bacterium]|nr:hypothetical protein [Acidobacteriota bacterium]
MSTATENPVWERMHGESHKAAALNLYLRLGHTRGYAKVAQELGNYSARRIFLSKQNQ